MSQASPNTEDIRRELAALGEAPPSDDELALLSRGELDDDPEVASVARLAELAEPLEFEDLSELELHRGWHRVGGARGGAKGGSKTWLFAAVGAAAAAAVLLIVLPPPGDAPEQAQAPNAEQAAQMGELARAALQGIDDGMTDTERATQVAAAYQRRLEQPQEQGG